MALVAYTRRRVFWGLVDYESDDDGPTYDSSNTEDGVDNSHNGRRVVIRWTRSGLAEDVMQTHFDLVNITAGNIDDTWTTGDFTAAEAALDTWWTSQKALSPTYYTLAEYRWYRVGPGATPPEPAVRVATRSVAGTVGSAMIAPQVAATVTLKTGRPHAHRHPGRERLLPRGLQQGSRADVQRRVRPGGRHRGRDSLPPAPLEHLPQSPALTSSSYIVLVIPTAVAIAIGVAWIRTRK